MRGHSDSTLVAAVSLTAVPSSAYARDWHGGGHRDGGHGGGRGHGWHGNNSGAGIAFGILDGVLAGAAIASQPHYYYQPSYSYGYGYGYPSYGYYR